MKGNREYNEGANVSDVTPEWLPGDRGPMGYNFLERNMEKSQKTKRNIPLHTA
jgi:hypothetical protein